jgi:dienelactone hydrolase
LVGEDDGMMDTLSMAELIKSKSANTVIYSYENAGHMFSGDGIASEFGMRMRLGGTIEGNEKARAESGKKVEEFLKEHHGR